MRQPHHDRGFTLLELLIVIAIIVTLATLLVSALASARRRTYEAVCRSQISAIKAALAMYEADMGRYPRLAPRGQSSAVNAFSDDAPALYAALRNRPTLDTGGGQNSPYLQDWKKEQIGYTPRGTVSGAIAFGSMTPSPPGSDVTPIGKQEFDLLSDLTYQQARNPPGGGNPQVLVLLDPWNSMFHYREWSSVRNSFKDTAGNYQNVSPVGWPAGQEQGNAPVLGPFADRPHSPETFDLWSGGPNAINEFGHPESDDITSWHDVR